MPLYRIADVVVEMTPEYEETASWYAPYEIFENIQPDFSIEASKDSINYFVTEGVDITEPIAENMVLCDEFNRKLLKYYGTYFHSSALKIDDKIYLFSGHSGVGKSTLTTRMCALSSRNTAVINDDKPSFRVENEKCTIYGTPFAGGTSKQINMSGELGGIIFLEQSDINELVRLNSSQAITQMLQQTNLRRHPKYRDRILTLFSQIISSYPIYLFKCTNTTEAAQLAFEVTKQYKA